MIYVSMMNRIFSTASRSFSGKVRTGHMYFDRRTYRSSPALIRTPISIIWVREDHSAQSFRIAEPYIKVTAGTCSTSNINTFWRHRWPVWWLTRAAVSLVSVGSLVWASITHYHTKTQQTGEIITHNYYASYNFMWWWKKNTTTTLSCSCTS